MKKPFLNMEPGAVLSGVLAIGVSLVLLGGFAIFSYRKHANGAMDPAIFVSSGEQIPARFSQRVEIPEPPEAPEPPHSSHQIVIFGS